MVDVRLVRLLLLLGAWGCAPCPPCEARGARPKAETCSADGADRAPSAMPTPAPPAAPARGASMDAPLPAPPAPAPEPPPAREGSLPEVKVESVGLHIGGGPNDAAAKAPYLAALEKHFDALRACYVKVDDPVKGGTFGVDLHIGREGGRPAVKQPRTGMKGSEFRDCVVRAFEQVEFDKPRRGPTVVSYSIRYSLGN